jgi:hypothetical protein
MFNSSLHLRLNLKYCTKLHQLCTYICMHHMYTELSKKFLCLCISHWTLRMNGNCNICIIHQTLRRVCYSVLNPRISSQCTYICVLNWTLKVYELNISVSSVALSKHLQSLRFMLNLDNLALNMKGESKPLLLKTKNVFRCPTLSP